MALWSEVREQLNISEEDENIIRIEKDLIKTLVKIREERGMTQSQLAELCNVKQPLIARMETSSHSPQIDSLLKILIPLGYTLQIVPLAQNDITAARKF
ncbi:MAG: helix-turn-helix transcriptional regulator [Lachnospiraceae bacterium]|nr:helix-turn-helix transcriptional regulator [Lachnospiraceae bacterium]